MKKQFFTIALLMPVIFLLPGCDLFKSKEGATATTGAAQEQSSSSASTAGSADVLISVGGKPLLTVKEFEKYIDDIVKMRPEVKQYIAFLPDAEYQICKNYAAELVAEKWAEKQGINNDASYQEELRRSIEMLKRQFALKFFQEKYPTVANLQVTDAQARAWYDENKETTPGLLLSAGGVSAQGVVFDKEADAKAFLEKVKTGSGTFDQAAREAKLTIKPFRSVSAHSVDVDEAIKELLLTKVKKFPSTEFVKSVDNKFWVVRATSKEEPKYVPFEQIKDELKQQLRTQKIFTEGIEQVKKEMGIVENTEYFDKKKKECEDKLNSMARQSQEAEEKAPAAPAQKNSF